MTCPTFLKCATPPRSGSVFPLPRHRGHMRFDGLSWIQGTVCSVSPQDDLWCDGLYAIHHCGIFVLTACPPKHTLFGGSSSHALSLLRRPLYFDPEPQVYEDHIWRHQCRWMWLHK